mgnify:CR=1 FL=1
MLTVYHYIKNAFTYFPKKTVHIIGVESELTPENKHIVVEIDEHYFICADNGRHSRSPRAS